MEYKITYSKRKTVGLRVTPEGQVEVRAPFGLSRGVIDDIVLKHTRWLEKRLADVKSRPLAYTPTQSEIEELKTKTAALVLPLVEKYAKIMGVQPTLVKFTAAKKVFGSCTSKKHLNFSFRLALYPLEAIEYVVVHELCHLKEMNHSARFWAEVEKILPDYKIRRKMLKESI